VFTTEDENDQDSAGKGWVWWVVVPAGLTAAAAVAQLIAVVVDFIHH
jgi:hypothetical protein